MRTYRSISAASAVALSALIGGFFGGRVLATQDRLSERLNVFTAAIKQIEQSYVEPVQSDRVVYSAINGMLQTLDPHSSFMDPKAYAQLRERQEGHYYGLGISINVVDGDITVMSLFEGSPAYKKGIRRGDVIARIYSEDAKGWTSEQAVLKLRGPRGTPVQVAIRRAGYDQLIDVEVVRDEIRIPSVHAAFMIAEGTGYIQLRDFSETTDRELGSALRDLTKQGMKRLVLDIRENPGGPLDQAIKVSNRFLKKGDLIVYTRGRIPNSDQDYRGVESSDYTDLPLIALANRRSASASEIVTGAIQDHDRGLVVGETTWGKALVQSIYRLSEGAGLALTTAHYFTPAGRLIQRPWDESFDEYLSYTTRDQNAEAQHAPADLKYTLRLARKVYSGGGIEPDRRMAGPIEGFNPGKFARRLHPTMFGTYAQRFDREGDNRFGTASDMKARRVLAPDFTVDEAMVQDFKGYVKSMLRDPGQFDEAGFNADIEFIRAMIRYEIDIALFDVAARRHLLEKIRKPQRSRTLPRGREALARRPMANTKAANRLAPRR
jgi:carboxyl-terminal processing protease